MKKLTGIIMFIFFVAFFFSCNNINENPIGSDNKKNMNENERTDSHFTSSFFVTQNVPHRSYVNLSFCHDTYGTTYNGDWTNFYTEYYETESFDVYWKLDWDIPYQGFYTYNKFEIRDISNNIVFTNTIVKIPSAPLQGTIEYVDYGVKLNPGQIYQFRVTLYCEWDEEK